MHHSCASVSAYLVILGLFIYLNLFSIIECMVCVRVYVRACLCVCGVHMLWYTCGGQRTTFVSYLLLSFTVGPKDGTQVVGFVWRRLCALIHLTNTIFALGDRVS